MKRIDGRSASDRNVEVETAFERRLLPHWRRQDAILSRRPAMTRHWRSTARPTVRCGKSLNSTFTRLSIRPIRFITIFKGCASVRLAIPIGSLLLLSACAVPTYLRPDTPNQIASESVQGSKAQILDAAVKVLIQNGYQITTVDNASGLISTAPQAMRVTPAQADCGRVKGMLASADPLTYPQPRTRVSLNVLAADNHIEVRSRIDDRLDPGSVQRNLTCVSRGVLEQEMLEEIKARL